MGAPGFAPPGVDIGLPPTGAAVDPKVAEALQTFLPATAQNIEAVVASDPQTALDWRAMAARMPYLSEAVAMYYTMADPNTSSRPKLIIAGALLYLISPWDVIPDAIPGLGQLDDAGVLLGALAYVYDMMTPRHLEQAQAWLRSQGIDPKPLFAIGKEFTEEEIIAAEQVSNKIKMLPAPSAAAPVAPDAQPAAPFQGW